MADPVGRAPKITIVDVQVALQLEGAPSLLLRSQEAGNILLAADIPTMLAIREAIEKLVAAFGHPQGRG